MRQGTHRKSQGGEERSHIGGGTSNGSCPAPLQEVQREAEVEGGLAPNQGPGAISLPAMCERTSRRLGRGRRDWANINDEAKEGDECQGRAKGESESDRRHEGVRRPHTRVEADGVQADPGPKSVVIEDGANCISGVSCGDGARGCQPTTDIEAPEVLIGPRPAEIATSDLPRPPEGGPVVASAANGGGAEASIQLIVDQRQAARSNRDYAVADRLRNELQVLGVRVNDRYLTWEGPEGMRGSFAEGSLPRPPEPEEIATGKIATETLPRPPEREVCCEISLAEITELVTVEATRLDEAEISAIAMFVTDEAAKRGMSEEAVAAMAESLKLVKSLSEVTALVSKFLSALA